MAEDQEAGALSTGFPAPPPFFKHFTPENQTRLKELQAQNSTSNLPPELQYLIPPPPPENGEYRSFGETHTTSEPLPSLVSQNVTQVYTSHPHDVPNIARLQATTLTKLVRSILASFLSLVDVLAKDPVQYSKRIEDLSTLFLNAHHLINEYRPHQARESLIRILEEKIETMREEVREVARFKGEVGTMLSATGQDDAEELKETGPDRKSTKDDARDAFQKRVWAEMEAIGT